MYECVCVCAFWFQRYGGLEVHFLNHNIDCGKHIDITHIAFMAVLYCNSVRPFFFFFYLLQVHSLKISPLDTHDQTDLGLPLHTELGKLGWLQDIYQSVTDYVYPQKICVCFSSR